MKNKTTRLKNRGMTDMYNIGDKIVYPMYGAGVIEAIEEKEILGVTQKYYVMKMPMGDMKVMIPMLNVEEIGIRNIIDGTEADNVFESFKEFDAECDLSWNKRYRENMLKIKSGDIYEVTAAPFLQIKGAAPCEN